MGDIRLFSIANGNAAELKGKASDLEKPLQNLIEKNLDTLLGVRFLASEYSTGKTHAGRIDTLGIDENDCPVILEYKRSTGENVINQGLFYLDWLMDHKAEFKMLVIDFFGKEAANQIDWLSPRLICIAADFTKYDSHAVQQMNRNIELIRYRRFGEELLLLELANAVVSKTTPVVRTITRNEVQIENRTIRSGPDKTVVEWLADISPALLDLFGSIDNYLTSLGDDVLRKDLKLYIAFKKIKNFSTIVIQKDKFLMYLRINPDTVTQIDGFIRDVRTIGHWGTGDLEISIKSLADLESVKQLIQRAYEGN